MVRRTGAQRLHSEQVVVDRRGRTREDRRELVLRGRDLVVLGPGINAQAPQPVVDLFHEIADRLADGAEVMLLELLALGGVRAEQRAAAQDEVGALAVVVERDEEVLLLGTDGRHDLRHIDPEALEHALGLLGQALHRAQQRRLLVERLAVVGDERRRDAQHLVFDEGVARRVPRRVSACLGGLAQAARRERRRVGLALDELLARERCDRRTVSHRVDERIVLLGGKARQRLEPVRVVRRAVFDRPVLHRVRDRVGHVLVELRAVLDGLVQALVDGLRQAATHDLVVEDKAPVDLADVFCHIEGSLVLPGCLFENTRILYRLERARRAACPHLRPNAQRNQ